MPEAHPRPGSIAGHARIFTTKGLPLKRILCAANAAVVAIGLAVAAVAVPASASTLSFSTNALGQYPAGTTSNWASLLRPPSSEPVSVVNLSTSSPSSACVSGGACAFIWLFNLSPEQTGTKRDGQTHYLFAEFTDAGVTANVTIRVDEGNEFLTCAPNGNICPDKITAWFSLPGDGGAVQSFSHPAGYVIEPASSVTVEQGGVGSIVIRKVPAIAALRDVPGEADPLSAVPVPAALPLLAGALGLGALVSGKRRRK